MGKKNDILLYFASLSFSDTKITESQLIYLCTYVSTCNKTDEYLVDSHNV